jgi:hypothetical protein
MDAAVEPDLSLSPLEVFESAASRSIDGIDELMSSARQAFQQFEQLCGARTRSMNTFDPLSCAERFFTVLLIR